MELCVSGFFCMRVVIVVVMPCFLVGVMIVIVMVFVTFIGVIIVFIFDMLVIAVIIMRFFAFEFGACVCDCAHRASW